MFKRRWFPSPRPHPQSAADLSDALEIRKGNGAFANAFDKAVEDRSGRECREISRKRCEKRRNCRRKRTRPAVLCFQREAEPVWATGAQEALGATLREPPGRCAHEHGVGAVLAADEARVCTHRAGNAYAGGKLLEAGERVCHPLERECERDDAATVDACR